MSSSLLDTEDPEHQWATETFLLTSVLTIATQNRPDQKHLHTRIRGYIDKLILRVTLGARSVRHVGTVEGLLLLAEWMPHLMLPQDQPYSNNSEQRNAYDEDCVAWNLIGLAVRQAYLLHLDTQSFPFEVESEPLSMRCRRRLAWICMRSRPQVSRLNITTNCFSYLSRRPANINPNGPSILVPRT